MPYEKMILVQNICTGMNYDNIVLNTLTESITPGNYRDTTGT